jgi:hypothetical protein
MKRLLIIVAATSLFLLMGFRDHLPTQTVNYQPEKMGPFTAKQVQGDCETGSNVFAEAKLKVYVSPDRKKVIAKIYFLTWEPTGDLSKGVYAGKKVLYEVGNGFKIKAIEGDTFWKVLEYQDTSEDTPEKKYLHPNTSAPWYAQINARIDGEDICEDADQQAQVEFIPTGKPIQIILEYD